MTTHTLPAEVLKRAVESAAYIYGDPKTAYRMQGAVESAIRIATPAIEAELLKRIIADFDADTGIFGKSKHAESYRRLLQMYLPTSEEAQP